MLLTKKVTILHDKYGKTMLISKLLNNKFIFKQSQDSFDNYTQNKLIKHHLKRLGYKVNSVPYKDKLSLNKNSTIFNIVETINGNGNMLYKAPQYLERCNIKFTGGNSEVIKKTTDKVITKQILIKNSLPTPVWVSALDTSSFIPKIHYIFKPVNEDASIGISGESVFYIETLNQLLKKLLKYKHDENKDYFAEEYIDGREFNISVISNNGKPLVLPPAELVFKDYTQKQFKVACYKAKWNQESFEYKHTARSFNFSSNDSILLSNLESISYKCWDLFKLKGYARIDFRVDINNNPKILEINSNPCIAIDSGFTAAAFKYGLTYNEILQNILSDLN